eukprot:4564301-Pyramimonas_sp.AAC.1
MRRLHHIVIAPRRVQIESARTQSSGSMLAITFEATETASALPIKLSHCFYGAGEPTPQTAPPMHPEWVGGGHND